MDDADLWFGFGVIAKAGEYNFDRFIHNGMLQLELPLYGQTYVDGEWESQGIWGGAGTSAFDVLRAYSAWHYNEGLCKKGITADAAPKWWKGPIFVAGEVKLDSWSKADKRTAERSTQTM